MFNDTRDYIVKELRRSPPGNSFTVSRHLLWDLNFNSMIYKNVVESILGVVVGSNYNITYTIREDGNVIFHRLEKESETRLRDDTYGLTWPHR